MLTQSVRMLLRRWPLCVLALVLAIAAGVGTFMVVKPVQESKAQVLFVSSVAQPGVTGGTNPFMNLGGSLGVAASVVQVVVSDTKVIQDLNSQGATAKFTVVPNLAENAGPVLLIAADDKSAAVAQKTLSAVIDEVNKQLVILQQARNVQPNLYITTITLTQSEHSLPVRKGQVQKAIIAAIGLLVICVLLILLLERRRLAKEEPAAVAPAPRTTPAKVTGGARRREGSRSERPDRPRQPETDEPRPARRAERRTRKAADAPDRETDSDTSILPGEMSTDSSADPARR